MQRKSRIIVAALAAIAVISTGLWFAFRPTQVAAPPPEPVGQDAAPEVALAPDRPDPSGIDPAGSLTLTSSRPLAAEAVKASLTIQPAVALKVERADQAGKSFTITPAQPLAPNQVYRFRLATAAGVSRPYQWSFQTRTAFRLLGTLPRDQGTSVPVNTGIEFTFTHDDYEDPTPYFTISPAVAGRFERHKKTVSFVPASPLEPGAIYTITLKKGLRRTGGEGELTEDTTFSFETQDPEVEAKRSDFYIPTSLTEFPVNDRPVFAVWHNNYYEQKPLGQVDVAIYHYADADAFIEAIQREEQVPYWSSVARAKYQEDLDGLAQVASFPLEPQAYDNGNYLIFPSALPPGYYLTTITKGEQVHRVRFQVTDLSSHVSVTATDTLIWLNDLATGKPVAGAQVTVHEGQATATTGADGVALLPTPNAVRSGSEPRPLLFVARADTQETVIYTPPNYWGYDTNRDRQALYWKYLYIDRSLYKPDDTVQVWGVLHPREPGATPVGEVTAEIIRNDYWSYDGGPLPLVTAALPVQNSTFSGGLDLPNLKPGHYELRVRMGEDLLRSQWFEVATYAKPAYQIELSADKRAVFSGEPVTLQVKASFFEGTPVPNLPLNVYVNWAGKNGETITTDANGEAVFTYTPSHDTGGHANYPTSLWFNVSAALPEVGEITAEHTIRLFPRDILPTARVEQGDGEATVSVELNRVTLAEINAGQGETFTGPAVPGQAVAFVLTELNWNKVEDGQYYDFIEKMVRTRYRYEEAHKEIGSFSAVSDAEGKASYAFPVDPEKQYRVDIRTQDSRGLPVTTSAYVSGRRFSYPYADGYYRWHHLAAEREDRYGGGIGEPIGFVMQLDEVPLAERESGFLFYTARRGLQAYTVQDSATFRVTLGEQDPPNTNLVAVHFDGRRYHEAHRSVSLDRSQRQLDVTVTPNQAAYQPGDEVTLQVQVLDRQEEPSAGTQVNLNLVDEALFALRDQHVNTLGSLYGDYVGTGILRSRSSHVTPEPGGGAEKGGEGGGVRRDFKDAVFFATVTTDQQGRATASFRVPDDLTTWRLTYQAVKPATMEAGSGSIGIVVKIPFFVEMVLGETYLTGDQPVLQLRSYGTALASHSGSITYQVDVQGPDGWQQHAELTGKPATPSVLPLEPLDAPGEYKVLVRASVGDSLTDALEKSFTVVDTYLRQNRVDSALLSPETSLRGAEKGLTTLTFLDWERGQYLNLLYRMRWQWGNRFEMRLAQVAADRLLKAHVDEGQDWPEPTFDALNYQAPDGSIAILPYSDGDLKLSALTADLEPDHFDRAALGLYFQRILNDEQEGRERKVLALYGLGALNQPVLVTARGLLAEPDLSLTEKLYLALTVAELGDLESVRPLYRALIQEQGEQIGRDLRIKAGADRDEQLEATALATALAGKLGEPETVAMLSYLAENQPDESLILLEQLLAVENGLAGLSDKPVAFTYVQKGVEHRRELKPGEHFQMALLPEDLASLRFKDVQGSVTVIATYEAAGLPEPEKAGATITRTYSPPSGQMKAGDIVAVTLNYSIPADAPNGGYEISDYLPSGLRLVERAWSYGSQFDSSRYTSWPISVEGQKVTFWADKKGRPIRYYTRVVTPGEYTAEEPVLQHQKSWLIYGRGERTAVRIEW